MNTDKKRNHFIPRLLLRRFSSRSNEKIKKGKHSTWLFQKSVDPKLINIKNIAVGNYFYGKNESQVEDNFQPTENQFAQILQELDRGVSPGTYSEELGFIVWLHAIRTRALRNQVTAAGDALFSELGNQISNPSMIAEFKDRMNDLMDGEFEKLIRKMPLLEQVKARKHIQLPGVRAAMLKQARESVTPDSMENIFHQLRSAMDIVGGFEGASADGHIKGLESILESSSPPDHILEASWRVIEAEERGVVLGDICVFAIGEEGEPGLILKHGNSWQELYLPISSSQILHASKEQQSPSLTIQQINQNSIEFSNEFVCGENESSLSDRQIQLIGNKSEIMSQKDIANIVSNLGR